MKKLPFILCTVLGCGITSELPAAFITAGATGSFTETNTNDQSGDLFSITNNSDVASGLRITSISFELATNLAFDVDGFSPNPGSPFEIVTSVPGGTVSTSLSDGLTLLTLDFTDFDPGEMFEFTIDVDRTMGLGVGQKQVMGSAFAGTTFNVTFDGPGDPFTLSNPFARLQENGRVFPFEAVAAASEQVEVEATTIPNPEPSSWIMFSLGAIGLGYVCLRRKRA